MNKYKKTKEIIVGIFVFLIISILGIGFNLATNKTVKIYGAVGGGKENFLADAEVQKIMRKDYGIEVQNDAWSNGKLIKNDLTYTEGYSEKANPYDFAFFSDQRYYEYYQTEPKEGEAARLKKNSSQIILNTPIVFYSWDTVTDKLIENGIVTEKDGVYYITDMEKLLTYILEGKKWSDIGLDNIYGNIEIKSTDPVTSSPGATYYGLLASIINKGELTSETLEKVIPSLQLFYEKAGFMSNTPTDLFDKYLREGTGTNPIIVDYEKSIIDFAVNNPKGYETVKDRIRILYPVPTTWNSHCIISFNNNGTKFIEALNDKRIQKIAFNKYGFRTGLTAGQYDVSSVNIKGIPQNIDLVVQGLKMDSYNTIIDKLKEVEL